MVASLLLDDYIERIYAGVLGKMVGVYLGRPFEGWTYERIMQELGEITYYVHEKVGVPLIVTDDDLSGTFAFLRALPNYGNSLNLTAAQIGETWLNYIIEGRTILWWGGMGNSTEHTAYLRLKAGIPAPESGSITRNGKIVAEQIGAQIFVDGWAMVSPGNPEQAAAFAHLAGSVSHDGEAIYAAQVIAAMEAAAFVESDLQKLLDIGLSVIPETSLTSRMIRDIRSWHQQEPDWRKTREHIAQKYGYDRYGGNCHTIPNHALIIFALLYGDDDFQKSLMIVNTSGWDTDCNSGNVGCLLGIKNGLRGLEGGPDWLGPITDRLYLSTADGGRSITDAVTETYQIARVGYALANKAFPMPKEGARFHFSLPGSVQGFQLDRTNTPTVDATLINAAHPGSQDQRCLAIRYQSLDQHDPLCLATPTFIPPDAITMPGYNFQASPTLYSGQTIAAHLTADQQNAAPVSLQLFIRTYGAHNQLNTHWGTEITLSAQEEQTIVWQVPDTTGAPIAEVGIALRDEQADSGCVYLNWLTWHGSPHTTFTRPQTALSTARPQANTNMWLRAWVNGVDHFDPWWPESFRLIQNYGRGLISQGTREWTDYQVSATITPHMAQGFGLAARVQGMRRYYALLITDEGKAQLIKALDGDHVLAETPFTRELYRSYHLSLHVVNNRIQAWIDDHLVFDVQDTTNPLTDGAIALICQEGRVGCDAVTIQPAG